MEEKKLFLLDAYALIYRAYYALLRSPRFTAAGFNTSAIFGFINTLDDLLRKENPGYIAVCFDPPHGRTFRHEQYAEYKAGRDKQPEDITLAIPYIKRILAAYRIPALEVEGYEADDVIGTLSRRASAKGYTTYMMTPDKDYGQLVTDSVFMYRPALKGQGFEVRGPEQVCERYGISSPRQVIDLLALEGDASDNVPGCPGVGEKTAVKLIAQFGSVENMLEHTDEIKGALRQKVEANADQIRMSKELVTICTDVPVEVSAEDLLRSEPDIDALIEIYKELEFKTLITRLSADRKAGAVADNGQRSGAPSAEQALGGLFDQADGSKSTDGQSSASQPLGGLFDMADEPTAASENLDIEARELTDLADISTFLAHAIADGTIGMCLNSGGNEAMTANAYGIALAYGSENIKAAYIPLPADSRARAELLALLAPVFDSEKVTVVGGDIKRDMLILRRLGTPFGGARWFDTAVAHYICAPEQKHDTASLAMTYLGIRTYDYEVRPADRYRPTLDPLTDLTLMAAVSLRLKPILEKEVDEKADRSLLYDVEMPLVAVLAEMEWEGARIDTVELSKISEQLTGRLKALEEEAYAIAGHPFNVGSPSQVGQILFDELKIDPKARKTKGGSWSTAEDVLEKYAAKVPLVRLILDIRGLKKLLATYVDALPKLINPATGKIHTTYNQTVTATGRISSTNPNLQNIPIRSADGRDIRRSFIADPGCLLLSADYSQIELRLMADLSGDAAMVEAFLSGEDIHRSTAAKIYHEDIADVTDTQRRNAKTANFGIIYGISAFGLSERLAIPRSEAKQLIDGYLATYPRVAEYMQESIEHAREKGYVTTIMGRRRYLPDITSRSNTVRSYAERNAINAPLQGSAADIIKVAMVAIAREINRRHLKSRMIMQVHDELIFNVVAGEEAEMQQLVIELMEKAYHGKVPMEVSAGLADNWLDAH
ncbi:MAG: DNA polymerase I [Muribaculaceae bacterium]|nr:DNA polymerase I [Muribaculaceae bacterium]